GPPPRAPPRVPYTTLFRSDPAVGHQGEEEMAVSNHVRADVLPLPDEVIVQRARRAHGPGQRERSELDVIRPVRPPGAAPAIAVDAGYEAAIRIEGERVLRPIVRCQDRIVSALEPDELPRRTGKNRLRTIRGGWATCRARTKKQA